MSPRSARVAAPPGWTGQWVAERLGVRLVTDLRQGADVAPTPTQLTDLLGLALRRNPRRAHLLVSTVLGKHVPADPREVHGAGLRLGARVAAVLSGAGASCPPGTLVLGYAETATGLGGSVAAALDAAYLHSTRREVPGVPAVAGFEEEHSHATSHRLLPGDASLLARPAPLVLVDDELSTGRTALNTIASLHALFPRETYVVAALVDLRGGEDVARFGQTAEQLHTSIEVVSLVRGSVELPPDVLAVGAELVEAIGSPSATPVRPGAHAVPVDVGWPVQLPESGRHGLLPAQRLSLDDLMAAMGQRLAGALARLGLGGEAWVLVLGTEELMEAPLRLALALAQRPDAPTVRFSTTTRSPVVAVDDPTYAIRTVLRFPAHDGETGDRFAYNVVPSAGEPPWDAIVIVVDTVSVPDALQAPGGLLEAVGAATPHLLLVTLPVAPVLVATRAAKSS